ncbi:hypothetical protein GRI44_13840, partial [Altererythrobacter confluentis]
MIDKDAPEIAPEDDQEIVPASMANNAAKALQDALLDDDAEWLRTVLTSLQERSLGVKKALAKAVADGQTCRNPAGLTT